MRIIAGEMRGRRLQTPKGEKTRPTTDRVRESLFSTLTSLLGPDLDASDVLDAFAGSGALGLESLSRGAASATFVENNRHAYDSIKANIATLGVSDRARAMQGDVFSLVSRGVLRGPYSLLLLDPPYTLDVEGVTGLLERLSELGALQPEAVAVWEHANQISVRWPEGFERVSDKKFGDTRIEIAMYRRGPAGA